MDEGSAESHRAQIHGTNPLERLNAAVERRTNGVGIFPSGRAIIRLSCRAKRPAAYTTLPPAMVGSEAVPAIPLPGQAK